MVGRDACRPSGWLEIHSSVQLVEGIEGSWREHVPGGSWAANPSIKLQLNALQDAFVSFSQHQDGRIHDTDGVLWRLTSMVTSMPPSEPIEDDDIEVTLDATPEESGGGEGGEEEGASGKRASRLSRSDGTGRAGARSPSKPRQRSLGAGVEEIAESEGRGRGDRGETDELGGRVSVLTTGEDGEGEGLGRAQELFDAIRNGVADGKDMRAFFSAEAEEIERMRKDVVTLRAEVGCSPLSLAGRLTSCASAPASLPSPSSYDGRHLTA